MGAFSLAITDAPSARRFGRHRGWIDELPWDDACLAGAADVARQAARAVWTRTAFSEYASAAAFAEITRALLAAGAPIDLTAAASAFQIDELVHAEVAARLATALGGAVPLEVDLARLVRPPEVADPLLAAAELIVRTSCVGEALTVPMLGLSRRLAGSPLVDAAIARIAADESHHAQLGAWFLDWADPLLDDAARTHLGAVAGTALAAFAPLLAGGCTTSGLGVVACDAYDPVFRAAVERHVVAPLARRGIPIPAADLAVVGVPA